MKNASKIISDKKLVNPTDVETKLRIVATAFVWLQQRRNEADYDNGKEWSRLTVSAVIDRTTAAFSAWHDIRRTELAQDYLISMLGARTF